jgi:hypothetical protein
VVDADLGRVEMKVHPHASLEVPKSTPPEGENQKPARRGWGGSLLLVVLAVIGSFHALIMIGIEGYRAHNTQKALVQLESEVSTLQNELNLLEVILKHGDDPLYHEQLARNLGYIFPDEKRVVTYPADR